MISVYICIVICLILLIVNGLCIKHAIRDNIISEIYMHTGLTLFFGLLTLELTIGKKELWNHYNILWLEITGWILYIPSAILVAASIIALHSKGNPEGADFTSTTSFIQSGIYRLIRQPMTLGLAIWSIALILVFQSIPAIILCLISLICFTMAARTESIYNIRKFGNDYKEYMKRVPMWNILNVKHDANSHQL